MNEKIPKVAVSYKWPEDKTDDRVYQFVKSLEEADVPVLYDYDDLNVGGDVSNFMRKVGASDVLCIFLSKEYLYSKNCMYELSIAWQRSKDNEEELGKRLKVWVMPGAEMIRDLPERIEIAKYWKKEHQKSKGLVRDSSDVVISGQTIDEENRKLDFANQAEPILSYFSNKLSPESIEDFQRWVITEYSDRASDTEIILGYKNVISDLNSLLKNKDLLTLVKSVENHGLINTGTHWEFPEECYEQSSQGMNVLNYLLKIEDDFEKQTWDVALLDGLENLVGGLLVLSISPEWLHKQRGLAQRTFVEHPGIRSSMSLGAGVSVNVVHFISSALMDGINRLDALFGDAAFNEKVIASFPETLRTIPENRQEHELKVHFIKEVLGEGEISDVDDSVEVDEAFLVMKGVMEASLKDKKDPYLAIDPSFRKFSTMIKDNLKMPDLYLLFPDKTSITRIGYEPIRSLLMTKTIFDKIKEKRKELSNE